MDNILMLDRYWNISVPSDDRKIHRQLIFKQNIFVANVEEYFIAVSVPYFSSSHTFFIVHSHYRSLG